jgi:hypothetical protein
MYLCHKCSGLLHSSKNEDSSGLFGCACGVNYTGRLLGTEENLTRSGAIQVQIKQLHTWMDDYCIHGVGPQQLGWQQQEVRRLSKLL